MNATTRSRKATIRARSVATRSAARISRRGTGTLASHCLAAGLAPRDARSVAGSLRSNAAKAGAVGTPGVAYRKGRARTCTRYTRAEVAAIALV